MQVRASPGESVGGAGRRLDAEEGDRRAAGNVLVMGGEAADPVMATVMTVAAGRSRTRVGEVGCPHPGRPSAMLMRVPDRAVSPAISSSSPKGRRVEGGEFLGAREPLRRMVRVRPWSIMRTSETRRLVVPATNASHSWRGPRTACPRRRRPARRASRP